MAIKTLLTTPLGQETYQLDLPPFVSEGGTREEGVQLASLLLKNIHVLEMQNMGFIPENVTAVNRLLEENFDELYTTELAGAIFKEKHVFHTTKGLNEEHLNQYLNGREIVLTDIISNPATFRYPENVPFLTTMCKHLNLAHKDVLREIMPIYQYISKFYQTGDINWHINSLFLATYFDNTKDAIDYLAQSDFTSSKTIDENIFPYITGNLSILGLPAEKMQAWYKLNARFGKKSIECFSMANKIDEIYDVTELLKPESSEVFILATLQRLAYQVTFVRAEESTEIAVLAMEYQLDERLFNKILDEALPKRKIKDNLPDFEFEFEVDANSYRFSKLACGDPRALFLAPIITSYSEEASRGYDFAIGEDGELFSINAFTNENANFYIVTNEIGNIIFAFYAWLGIDKNGHDIMVLDHNNHPFSYVFFQTDIIKNIFDQVALSNIEKLYLRSNIYCLSGTSKITPKQAELVNSEFTDNFSEITAQLIESQQRQIYTYTPEEPKLSDDYTSYKNFHTELNLEWAKMHFYKLLQQTTKHGFSFILDLPLRCLVEEGIYTVDDINESFNTHTFPFPYQSNYSFCTEYKQGIKNFITLAKRGKIEFSDSWKAIQILNNHDLDISTSWESLQKSSSILPQPFICTPGIDMEKLIESSLAGEDYSTELDAYCND